MEERDEIWEVTVPAKANQRLDIFLSCQFPQVSRTKLKAWCKAGLVEVDEQIRKVSYQLQGGEQIILTPPQEPENRPLTPENLPLEIIHEDEAIAVVNKAAGMVVHPGAGVYSGTLANALAFHFQNLSSQGGPRRPGIVHRLDKGTTGIILVAKTDAAHANLSQQWQDGEVTKVYQALVWGRPDPPEGEIKTHMGRHPRRRQKMTAELPEGRFAHTRYKCTQTFEEAAQVNVHILTGRTHQIRVHLAHLGYPVVGDALYGGNRHRNLAKTFTHMPAYPMLHAALLRFKHPTSGQVVTFKQPPPAALLICKQALSRWPF